MLLCRRRNKDLCFCIMDFDDSPESCDMIWTEGLIRHLHLIPVHEAERLTTSPESG